MNIKCFHCDLDIPKNVKLPIKYKDATYYTCCLGCQAVTNSIISSGLERYYEERTIAGKKASLPEKEFLDQIKLYDAPEIQKEITEYRTENLQEISLLIDGITCAACAWLIEQHLSRIIGINKTEINYTTYKAKILWDNSKINLSNIILAFNKIGFNAYPYDSAKYESIHQKEKKKAIFRLWISGLSMMQVMMYAIPTYLYNNIPLNILSLLQWASFFLTLPVFCYAALPFYQSALIDLKNKRIGMDLPISIAIILAFISSFIALIMKQEKYIFFDSISMLVFFLLAGRFLEYLARHKAANETEKLAKLIPKFCHKINDYNNGISNKIEEFLVNNLTINDYILIKPGETIPIDGIVIDGQSDVNESMLTGESIPVIKKINSKVIAGTNNNSGQLTIKVTNIGNATRLGSIIKLLDNALASKTKLSEISNKYASKFILFILLISILTFIFWSLKSNYINALWTTISLLVITCPCALSLATPTALAASTGKLIKKGVLISGANALETIAKINDIIFDKTGTLTIGKFEIVDKIILHNYDENKILNIISILENHSEHPIAKAFKKINIPNSQDYKIKNLKNYLGRGISGIINDEIWYFGNLKFIEEITNNRLNDNTFSKANTIVALSTKEKIIALFTLADTLKDNTKNLIMDLNNMRINTHLLSGDNEQIVKDIATKLNFKYYKAQATPEDKLLYINKLQEKNKITLMVGDGVNDAPVLAKADVSIAVDSSADITANSSDIILISKDINIIKEIILIGKKTIRIIHQNYLWAILYNIIAVPIAALGFASPAKAALGMTISSLLVVLNALRLLK